MDTTDPRFVLHLTERLEAHVSSPNLERIEYDFSVDTSVPTARHVVRATISDEEKTEAIAAELREEEAVSFVSVEGRTIVFG